jgi:BMFP domain-containing protein YqiC
MRLLLALPLLLIPLSASAAPPVYRCETSGKVSYSDSPCVGAKVIDATPNQGVDQMSGKSRKGRDVQRTELNHAFDDALRPLTGKSRDEMDVMRRRVGLPARDQGKCRQLDARLPELEAATRRDTGASKARTDIDLYQARKRYFDLKC